MTLIFVYGTLKRGGSNHRQLDGQTFVGSAHTTAGYTLYELEGYPGMVHKDDDHDGVGGEIWSVDNECLSRLDQFEGVDEGLYRREPITLLAPFSEQRVDAYLYIGTIKDRRKLGSEWL